MIGGVCGGLGDYFGIDPTLVRLIFILLTVFGGGGVLIYFILWIIVPEEGRVTSTPQETMQANAQEVANRAREFGQSISHGFGSSAVSAPRTANPQGEWLVGLTLIVLGGLFLLNNFAHINFGQLWPITLIIIGLALLGMQLRKPKP